MPIPDSPSMMLPILQHLGDGKEHLRQTLATEISELLSLSEEDLSVRYENGDSVFLHRLRWAQQYLLKANLITKPQKNCFQITNSGQALLKKNLCNLSVKFLKQNYPAVAQWLQKPIKEDKRDNSETLTEIASKPPEELLEDVYSILCSDLEQVLLDQVKKSHWSFFERLVVDLLTKMGYGGSRQDAGRVIGKSGDNGIDGVINEDKLGLDVVYIQAKRYTEPVTISQVRDFSGALDFKKAKKGVFITTSSFPKSAEEYVAAIDKKIILIDGLRLAELMIEYNVGVVVKEVYEVKRIDYDYFDENEL